LRQVACLGYHYHLNNNRRRDERWNNNDGANVRENYTAALCCPQQLEIGMTIGSK
jgi:hypothetical protein